MNTIYHTHEAYARLILDPSRALTAPLETDLKISEALKNVQGFKVALHIVNQHLDEAQAAVNHQVCGMLCGRVQSVKDWEIQKRIYLFVKKNGEDPQLIKQMLLKSADLGDAHFFTANKTKYDRLFPNHPDVFEAVIVGLARLGLIKDAFFKIKDFIEKKQASMDVVVSFIDALPLEERKTAKKIYHFAHHHQIRGQAVESAMRRFTSVDEGLYRFKKGLDIDLLTPIDLSVLVGAAIKNKEFDLVREIYSTALASDRMCPILWENIIDFEYRIMRDYKTADRLFMDSPIEVDVKSSPLGPVLDLHGHSYGAAALMVYSCIRAFQNSPDYGDTLVVITGIGWKDTPNFLKMQNYIRGSVTRKYKNINVVVSPENPGRLILKI